MTKTDTSRIYLALVARYRLRRRKYEQWIVFLRDQFSQCEQDLEIGRKCHSIIDELLQEKIETMKDIKYYVDLAEKEQEKEAKTKRW